MWPFSGSWFKLAQTKREDREARITIASEKLDLIDASAAQQYLNATATEIVQRIKDGEWTAVQVLTAYISRAIEAQKETNPITEVLFAQALDEAKKLDIEFSQTRRVKGPLHGVPVSFKDQFAIAGSDASVGFVRWCNKPSTRDAELVRIVRDAGGIPIAKTNVPQTMLSFECSNPVFGRTTNPWSSLHIPGGSSGGEAALLACDGSALGFGSDVGGSLRIPAVFSGIYSLKPASRRVTSQGAATLVKGFNAVEVVMGPMGRSVEDLVLASRLVFGKTSLSYDNTVPLPYRDVELPKHLKFGYYLSDGIVKASPASQRAVLETVAALKNAGHECIEFEVPHAAEAFAIFTSLTAADGYATLFSHLGSEPTEDSLFLVTLTPKIPGFIRSLSTWLIRSILGDTQYANILTKTRKWSVAEFWRSTGDKEEYTKLFYEKVWDHHNFDGIIAPGFPTPALPHGATKTLVGLAGATILYNIIDSPVGVVPVTRVDPKSDGLTPQWFSGPGRGSKIMENEAFGKTSTSKGAVYNPEAMKGLPVGVQIVGKRWEEEKVLAMMKIVDDVLGERGFGPGAWRPKESRGKSKG